MRRDRGYSEAQCPCAATGVLRDRIGSLAINVAFTHMHAFREFGLCQDARDEALEMAMVTMITYVTQSGTIIESFTPEAEAEALHVIDGLESRLRARVQSMYAAARDMKPETLAEARRRYEDRVTAAFKGDQR